MNRKNCYLLPALLCVSATAEAAESNSDIDPGLKYAWGENIGWTNWRDANLGSNGVEVSATHLGGFLWGENVGWMNVGAGAPADGVHYANSNGLDFGVNIDENDDLFGLAWGKNIGWVNFDTRDKGIDRARITCETDPARLRGYIWGENVGWINLDDETHYVAGDFGLACVEPFGDHDGDGDVDLDDYVAFEDCLNGPNSWPNPTPPTTPQGCLDWFNSDADWDVDLQDSALFQASFTGSE